MKKLREFLFRLRALFRREKLDAEMQEEMRQHLELTAAEKASDGASRDEARYAAQRKFGNVGLLQERVRDQRGFVWLEHLLQDLRYAARSLYKSPGFTAVVIFSLALGIGANTTIFSLVNDVLLRSLPVKNPHDLVLFRVLHGENGSIASGTEGKGGKDPKTGRSFHPSFSLLTFEQFRAHHPPLSEVFAYTPFSQLNVLIDGQPETSVSGQLVSANYHAGLGVPAILGRTLTPDDERASAESVAVISHRYWANRFGRDAGILGKTIQLNDVPTTIVGVTAPGFSGALQVGESADISVPLALFTRYQAGAGEKARPWYWWIRIMGRLAPGATPEQARAVLEPVFQETARESWRARPPVGPLGSVMPALPTLAVESGAQGENDMRRDYAHSVHLLMGLVSLVLLAACANVANLLLARGAARRREIAVRMALGAGRGRIVRQLLAESLLLASLSAAIGTALAWWGRDLLLAIRPFGSASVVLDLPLDSRVLGFTVAVAVATALLFGLAPALLATRVDLKAEFQGGTRLLSGGARSRLSQALMVAQISLSLVLLVSTGLFARTLRNLQDVDVGFNRRSLVLFRIDASAGGYKRDQFAGLHTRLRERLEKLPGVSAVTWSSIALLSDNYLGAIISVPGYSPSDGRPVVVQANAVAANFFAAMQMPLVLGRGFTEHDDATAPKVAVINQSLAQKFFGSENPIGRRFSPGTTWDRAREIEIVGVTRDALYNNLRSTPQPSVYTPVLQQPLGIANFAVRTIGDPAAIFPAIRAAVREVDSRLPVINLRTQDEQIDRLNSQPLLFARLSGFFGVLALVLACVGLYGLMSYNVLRRTGEIGLRIALGALPWHVLRMILCESLGLICLGVLAGLGLAVAASRLVATMLFGLSPTDPLTYGGVALALVAVALLAALLPARRAAKVDPMVALRAE